MDWSPDGRILMTATTAPRMRVNNGIQLFRQGDLTRQAWPLFLSETHRSLAKLVPKLLDETSFPIMSEARVLNSAYAKVAGKVCAGLVNLHGFWMQVHR